MVITAERADSPDAVQLIGEFEAILEPRYPPESRHGLNIDRLIAEGVAFFLLRVEGVPAGRGGVQLFGTECGELKRMYVQGHPDSRALAAGRCRCRGSIGSYSSRQCGAS